METANAIVGEENCEKPHNEIENEDVAKGMDIESESKSKDTTIESIKDNLVGVEDEDVELSEVEASKDFGGNIDEDELLKDTEGEETCNIVTESSETVNPLQTDSNLKGDVDSTEDNCKQSSEDQGVKENEEISVQENSNTEDGMPDSSNENLKDTEMNNSFNLELTEEDEENECKSKNEEKCNEPKESVKIINKEGEISEAEMAVTSSNNEPIEKNSEVSSHSFSDTNEVNENSNSISDEIENDSLNTVSKADGSITETVENVRLNVDDESNEKTSHNKENENKSGSCYGDDESNEKTSHNAESQNKSGSCYGDDESNEKTSHDNENQNKSDSCDGTKFLHIDQENSRPEETFESMEPGGEDPFAQTSDVAMDTSESNEKEGDLDKSDVPMEISESIEKGGDKSDVTMDVTENAEKEKDLIKEAANSNNEVMDVSDITLDSTENVEAQSERSSNVAGDENAVCESNKCDSNIATEGNVTENTDLGNDDCEKSDEGTKQNKEVEFAAPHEDVAKQVENNEKVGSMTSAQKLKVGRLPGSRSKRKSSSEDSNSDIDIEELSSIEPTPKRTPKRNAARRAESQIKVLSQLDKEMKERIDENATISQKGRKSNDPHAKAPEGPQSEAVPEDDIQTCFTCKKVGLCQVNVLTYGKKNYFCNDDCFVTFRDGPLLKPGEGGEIIPPSTVMSQLKSADIQPMDRAEIVRKCSQCTSVVNGDDEKTLSWETMDFCSEDCLGKYQQELGSHCANCKGNVQQTSLGKYCVRFGYEVKQFCCSTCLEEFKKGLKVCSFCQKDISSGAEGFLAPVGDKGTFKDFCTPACMEKYEQMSSNQPPPPQIHQCDVCDVSKQVEFEVFFDNKVNKLCSDLCFSAYKFANKLTVDRCDMCKKYFDKDAHGEKFNIFYEGVPHNFCCKTCMNVYILAKRKIVPCNWCKVKKYNFDMIKRVQNTGQVLMMCSLNCLTLYQVSINAVSSKRIKCDMCNSVAQAQYHLTMSDATIRNFCTYPCVMNFQQQYSKSPITLPGSGDGPPIPTGAPKRVVPKSDLGLPVPVISSVSSLANGQPATATTTSAKPSGKLNLVARLCEPPVTRNKFTQTRPIMNTKSVSCRPHSNSVETQTEEGFGKAVIPIPVPIFVPCPMAMYSMPFPVPVPFPLPIPVPIFLPTTRNSIKGIMKEIKRIREKVPDDPFEAELLMMAEMVAEDKPQDKTSSDSEVEADNDAAPSAPNSDAEGDEDGGGDGGEDNGGGEEEEREFTPEAVGEGVESSNTFGDDIMQMALKIATELDTPATGDLEAQLPSSSVQPAESSADGNSSDTVKKEARGRKRAAPSSRSASKRNSSSESKKRKSSHKSEISSQPSPSVDEPKPDANMKLKFTFGVNAWKSWVTLKNAEIEKLNTNAGKKLKPFKTDMLQLTTDELNYSLCLFIKEVKKPNGTPYAPDTIYYLCLGIQQYLFENGRIDNIFTDPYFETFTDTLDEVAKKFSELFNDHHYIVTRVEEEHLWESKQLGAHSPHVLLSTLMFFNTKHFNLTSVDEHLLLSFSHILKHWKRNQNQSGSSSGRAPGSRNVLLRFYPPQSLVDDPNLKKKKVYEQQENEDNPLRCPVKLYEFYLSKCPESVKNRNDVFYLQPERSCVPDSPVWYSTMALQRDPLEKMLNRVKMVKEINVALLVP